MNGAVAQLARAPALQAGGQEFDSPQLHQRKFETKSQEFSKTFEIISKQYEENE